MSIIDKIRRKIVRIIDKIFVKVRNKSINNKDFSIISNNCWGGFVCKRFGVPYLSPTVGLYFYAEDYIKLIYNLQYYMNLPLQFISVEESKYSNKLKAKGQINVPIGKLDDIEIVFLHYKSEQEAREKWERRVKRINYDNLIFKFSEMNDCSYEHLQKFDALDVDKKIVFTTRDYKEIKSGIFFKSYRNQKQILNDIYDSRYINIKNLINSKKTNGKINFFEE